MSFWNSYSEIQRTTAFSYRLNIFHFLCPVIHLNWSIRVLYYRHLSVIYPLLRGGNWIYDGQNTAGNKIFTTNLYRFVLLLPSAIFGLLRWYVHGLPLCIRKFFKILVLFFWSGILWRGNEQLISCMFEWVQCGETGFHFDSFTSQMIVWIATQINCFRLKTIKQNKISSSEINLNSSLTKYFHIHQIKKVVRTTFI